MKKPEGQGSLLLCSVKYRNEETLFDTLRSDTAVLFVKTGENVVVSALLDGCDKYAPFGKLIEEDLRHLFGRCGEENTLKGRILLPPALPVIEAGKDVVQFQFAETALRLFKQLVDAFDGKDAAADTA